MKSDGSLFDLRRDSVEDIVAVITDPSTIPESRARKIANGILHTLKTREKPAG